MYKTFLTFVLLLVFGSAHAADEKQKMFDDFTQCEEAVVNNDAGVYQPIDLSHKGQNVPNGKTVTTMTIRHKTCAQMHVYGGKMKWVLLVEGSTLRCSTTDGQRCNNEHYWDDRCGNHIAEIRDVREPEPVAHAPPPRMRERQEDATPIEESRPIQSTPEVRYVYYNLPREEEHYYRRESSHVGEQIIQGLFQVGAAYAGRTRGTRISVNGNCNFSPYACNQQNTSYSNSNGGYGHHHRPRDDGGGGQQIPVVHVDPWNPVPGQNPLPPQAPYQGPQGPVSHGGGGTVGGGPLPDPNGGLGGPVQGPGNSGVAPPRGPPPEPCVGCGH